MIGKFDRETLGRVVREAWVKRAMQLKDTNVDHLVPFHHLKEVDKETDRQIGETVATFVMLSLEAGFKDLIDELERMNEEITKLGVGVIGEEVERRRKRLGEILDG